MIGAWLGVFSISLLAVPEERLPSNSPIIRYVNQRHRTLLVALPTEAKVVDLPPSVDALEAMADIDARWTKERFEIMSRSSIHLYPRDLYSLDSRQISVMKQVRRLIHQTPEVDGSFQLSKLAGGENQRRSFINAISTGHETAMSPGQDATARLIAVPGYVCVASDAPSGASFALDLLPPSTARVAAPVIPPDLAMETLRERSFAALLSDVPESPVELAPGIYEVADLLDQAFGGANWPVQIDRRFLTRRVLFASEPTISPRDLLLAVCRTYDLYLRSVGDVKMIAISPEDPRTLYDTKRRVDIRNMVADLLEYLYTKGQIPTGVSPDHFLTPNSPLSDPEKTLVLRLGRGGASNKLQSDKNLSTWIGDGTSLQIVPYLSICVRLDNLTSSTNACATYP